MRHTLDQAASAALVRRAFAAPPRLAVPLLVGLLIGPLATPLVAQQLSATAAGADSAYRAPGTVRGAGPNGATLRCRDGSYPAPFASDAACEGKGGVRVRFPVLRTPAPAAARPAAVAPAAPAAEALTAAPPATESRANVRIPAQRAPDDATLMCRDGTYIRADTSAARCASNGGLRLRFPSPPKARP